MRLTTWRPVPSICCPAAMNMRLSLCCPAVRSAQIYRLLATGPCNEKDTPSSLSDEIRSSNLLQSLPASDLHGPTRLPFWHDRQVLLGAVCRADFVNNSASAADCEGHGSIVSSIAIGRTVGVAKEAKVVAVRVLDCSGTGAPFSSRPICLTGLLYLPHWLAHGQLMDMQHALRCCRGFVQHCGSIAPASCGVLVQRVCLLRWQWQVHRMLSHVHAVGLCILFA